jgi:hypothetical protein
MLFKFIKLVMQTPYAIPDLLTKWHIPFLFILVVLTYLSSVMFEF